MMDIQPLSWSFGDPMGWAIGCGFFLFISTAIGGVVYGLSYRLLSMGSLDQGQRASHRPCVVLGGLAALMIFAAFYLTSLSGFSQLDYRAGQLTIHYMLPERTVVLPVIEVMNVQEEPAFKGQWRLVLITDTSGTYERALTSQADVHQAVEWIQRHMRQPNSLQQ
jgi:hypothetical protein